MQFHAFPLAASVLSLQRTRRVEKTSGIAGLYFEAEFLEPQRKRRINRNGVKLNCCNTWKDTLMYYWIHAGQKMHSSSSIECSLSFLSASNFWSTPIITLLPIYLYIWICWLIMIIKAVTIIICEGFNNWIRERHLNSPNSRFIKTVINIKKRKKTSYRIQNTPLKTTTDDSVLINEEVKLRSVIS